MPRLKELKLAKVVYEPCDDTEMRVIQLLKILRNSLNGRKLADGSVAPKERNRDA